MAAKTVFVCAECGQQSIRWMGKCPACGEYNSLVEEIVEKKDAGKSASFRSAPVIQVLRDAEAASQNRRSTGIPELDNALCGGLVDGSVLLCGGEPGIGKSTLILQVCETYAKVGSRVLYASGEESAPQIKMRAQRLGVSSPNLYVMTETGVGAIEAAVEQVKPALLVIDSIQTMTDERLGNPAGSVTQIRECTNAVLRVCKPRGITAIIVGHVTREGSIAGPKLLEHMVDAVLYFEGEKKANYRIIRAVKNRFGATDEIGIFEMTSRGLAGIANPSEYMLSGRPLNVSGSTVTAAMEGSRPILAEVQALACATNFGLPRRVASGMDLARVSMLLAIIEKRAGIPFGQADIYVNIAGGMKILEPALDAAVIASCVSGMKNAVVDPYTVIFGEVGLAGEMRSVGFAERRVAEAAKLGFRTCVLPKANLKGLKIPDKLEVVGAANIRELMRALGSQ